MTESFAELFEQSQTQLAKLKSGAIITGTVIDVRNDVVVINTGLKSEGIVPIEQFRNDAGEIDVGVGDQVKVALESVENGFGETVVSRDKAKRSMVWDELEEALEKGDIITGRISGKVKGGFTVDIKDVRAFLQLLHQLLALFRMLALDHRTAGDHDIVALAIQLDELELEFLAFQVTRVAHGAHVDQRTRQECADVLDVDGEAALDLAADAAGDGGVGFQRFFQLIPDHGAFGFLAR